MESIYTKTYKNQRMGKRTPDMDKNTILLNDLVDVLPKVPPTKIQEVIDKLDEMDEILQRLMKDRIVSVIPKSLLRFEPTREILEHGDDIHLRRCEAMLARGSNPFEVFGCKTPGQVFNEVISYVTLIENDKAERHFLARKRDFRKRKIPSEEVLLFYPFSVYNINSLLGGEALDMFEDYLFQDKIPLVEAPSICPGFGNGLLLCRVLLGQTKAITQDLQWPSPANSVRIESFSKDVDQTSGIRYLVEEKTQVLPYCLIRFNPEFAARTIKNDLSQHTITPKEDMISRHRDESMEVSHNGHGGRATRSKTKLSSLLPQNDLPIFGSQNKTFGSGAIPKHQSDDYRTDTFLGSQPNKKMKIHPNLARYIKSVTLDRDDYDRDCMICTFALTKCGIYDEKGSGQEAAWFKLIHCGHVFHATCLEEMVRHYKEFLQCPYCKMVYGTKVGNQPPGTMTYKILPQSLPGYPESDTLEITYNIKPGVQGPHHPNPGLPYHCPGFPRVAYLPNNSQGNVVLKLLQKAFDQKLTFTVGQSTTTGKDNVVTWNDIHHKTQNYAGGQHGYPDPNYMDQTIRELAQHGIVDE